MTNAFVFPGQGAQFVGMGKDLASDEVYTLADEIFSKFHADNNSIKESLTQVSFEGPEEELKRTVYTQPAILALSLALAKKLKEAIAQGKLEKPSFVAGHSLGEFAALYMADVLSFEDTLKLVIKRAALMEKAPAGAMTAVVALDEDVLNSIIETIDGVSVANYNAPDQIVITGTKEAVAEAGTKITEKANELEAKVRVIPLVVGGAFHSPLMQEASEDFAKAIDEAVFNEASVPVLQNIVAQPVSAAAEIKTNLKQQMTGSVRWTQTVKFLLEQKLDRIIEVGPGKVLAGLTKKQDRRFPMVNIQSLEDVEKLSMLAV